MDRSEINSIQNVPNYGLKVKFNHVFPEVRSQNLKPSWKQCRINDKYFNDFHLLNNLIF